MAAEDGGDSASSLWQASPAVLRLLEEDQGLATRRAELQAKEKLFREIKAQLSTF